MKDKTGLGAYADGMQELGWVVGDLLDKLDERLHTGAEQALKQADNAGWTVVSMKYDWTRIF